MNLRIVLAVMVCATAALIVADPDSVAGQNDGPNVALQPEPDQNGTTGAASRPQTWAPTRPKTGSPRLFRAVGSPAPVASRPVRLPINDRRNADRSLRQMRTSDSVHQVQATRVVQRNAGESAVARELRALYEKNGKQMPEMNIKNLPKTLQKARGRTAERDLRRKPNNARRSRFDFLKRLLPFRRSNTRPQARSQSRPGRPVYRSESRRRTRPSQPRITAQPARLRRIPQQRQSQKSERIGARIRINAIPNPPAAIPAIPATSAAESEFFPADRTPSTIPTPKNVPLLIDSNQPQPKPVKQAVITQKPQAKIPVKSDPLNPFPDLSETEADDGKAAIAKADQGTQAAEEPADETEPQANPFTGKKLTDGGRNNDDPFAEPAKTPAAGTPETKQPVPSQERPLIVQPEPKRVPTALQIKSAQQARREQLGRQQTATNAATARTQRSKLSREAKLWLIAERKGLPGFRGFCPVELRNHRDLVDSQAVFKSAFHGKTYFLSSLEAKAAFDRNPQKYAPAMGGRDVIRLIDGTESVEGSLAHAVWFRDRLYFFSSAQTLQKFTRNPKNYAASP